MPTDTAPPVAVPKTAVAPTPGKPYNISEHPPTSPAPRNQALTDALNRLAGVAPTRDPNQSRDAKFIPSQPPRSPLEQTPNESAKVTPAAPDDDKVAPHVKFITPDEREPGTPTATPDVKPAAIVEPSQEVLKSASAQVREAFEKLKIDFTTRAAEGELTKKELANYRAKATQYEDRIKALESAEGRAKELETRVLTLDEQLRVTNYIQHPEFHEKFTRPVSEALQSGRAMVKELMVQGESRLGTDEDFDAVLAQPNYTLAADKAAELFGERMGNAVFEESKRVKLAQQARAQAVKDSSLKSQEWVKTQQARAAENRTRARSEFDKVAKDLDSRYPGLYTPPAEDAEAMAARQQGEAIARIIVDGKPEGMSDEQYLATVAKSYHRAASWPLWQLKYARVEAERDKALARLAEYEKSTPSNGSRQQPGGVKQDAGGVVVGGQTDYEAAMHKSLTERANRGSRR